MTFYYTRIIWWLIRNILNTYVEIYEKKKRHAQSLGGKIDLVACINHKLKEFIIPTITCGCETWKFSEAMEKVQNISRDIPREEIWCIKAT